MTLAECGPATQPHESSGLVMRDWTGEGFSSCKYIMYNSQGLENVHVKIARAEPTAEWMGMIA